MSRPPLPVGQVVSVLLSIELYDLYPKAIVMKVISGYLRQFIDLHAIHCCQGGRKQGTLD